MPLRLCCGEFDGRPPCSAWTRGHGSLIAVAQAALTGQKVSCCRYNYQKIQGAMAEKAAAAATSADIEKQPMLHMSNGVSSPDKPTTQFR